jgi:predicted RNase H-like HicB family nuclease
MLLVTNRLSLRSSRKDSSWNPILAPPRRWNWHTPDVPGCATVGDTEDETRRRFRDALAAHFEVMRETGSPIPELSSSVNYVEVAA